MPGWSACPTPANPPSWRASSRRPAEDRGLSLHHAAPQLGVVRLSATGGVRAGRHPRPDRGRARGRGWGWATASSAMSSAAAVLLHLIDGAAGDVVERLAHHPHGARGLWRRPGRKARDHRAEQGRRDDAARGRFAPRVRSPAPSARRCWCCSAATGVGVRRTLAALWPIDRRAARGGRTARLPDRPSPPSARGAPRA